MKIGLLGHGVVGSGVRKIIDDNHIPGVEIKRILVHTEKEIIDKSLMTTNVDVILQDPEIDIVVECMGGIEPARSYALRAMQSGKNFVTSNKKMLASSFSELLKCAKKNHVTIGYEASCGGGIPWMANLERIRRIEEIQAFRGILNGTTNYILSRMYQEKQAFDAMLKDAQKLGYAERDPSDDIDGLDVRYKVALSCAKAFGRMIDVEQIPTFGIRNIQKGDLEYGREIGCVIKLVGKANLDGMAVVMPVFVKQEDIFASIPLNYNAIECTSASLGLATFIGQGAGSLPTAHAVVQDVLDVVNGVATLQDCHLATVNNTSVEGKYYVRTTQREAFEGYIEQEAKCGFLTKKMCIEKLCDLVRKSKDEAIFVAEVMK